MTTTAAATAAPKSYSTIQIALRKLRRHKAAMVSLAFIVLMLLVALLAPLIAPHDPNAQDLAGVYGRPCPSG